MPGLVPGIHALLDLQEGVDGRDKPGHDELWLWCELDELSLLERNFDI
jgi:hypothetical protein